MRFWDQQIRLNDANARQKMKIICNLQTAVHYYKQRNHINADCKIGEVEGLASIGEVEETWIPANFRQTYSDRQHYVRF